MDSYNHLIVVNAIEKTPLSYVLHPCVRHDIDDHQKSTRHRALFVLCCAATLRSLGVYSSAEAAVGAARAQSLGEADVLVCRHTLDAPPAPGFDVVE
jgi:hypothetical protein